MRPRAHLAHRVIGKRGGFYIPFVSIMTILFIITAYFMARQYLQEGSTFLTNRDIGGKQGEILNAVREGERINLYCQEAARIAKQQAAQEYVCGESYLNRRIIGRGGCDVTMATFYQAKLFDILAAYPRGSLTDLFTGEPVTSEGGDTTTVTIEGTRNIPIVSGTLPDLVSSSASGTFSGSVTGWPVDSVRVNDINDLFGKRSVAGTTDQGHSPSRNHGGLDISSGGQAGYPVHSLLDGTAQFIDSGENSYVRVKSNGVWWEYMHTRPAGSVKLNGEVPVKAGEEIAVTAPYGNSDPSSSLKPHLHLQVRLPTKTGAQVKTLWPNNAGLQNEQQSGKTYAIITDANSPALLDPVCFFARDTITKKLTDSGKLQSDSFEACDAYEKAWHLSGQFTPVGSTVAVASAIATDPNAPAAQSVVQTTAANPVVASDTTKSQAGQTSATAAPSQLQGSTTSSAPYESAKTSSYDKVRRTYANLETQNLFGDVEQAAKDNGIDAALLYAVITQESEGKADAASATGCYGITQFCSDTAKGYFDPADRPNIVNCHGTRCDPAQMVNDPRGDPRKSIKAAGKLLRDNIAPFKDSDQKEALALIAYNAGGTAAKQARDRTTDNPSWEALRNVLLYDQTISMSAAKRKEVTDYVPVILQKWMPAWGGGTFSGTSYTTTTPGYYELHVKVSATISTTTSQIIKEAQDQITACTTNQCITDALATIASSHGAQATLEQLDGSQGCMDAAERAQAYIARNIEWCKSSPDSACACPLDSNIQATASISTTATQLITLNGAAVQDTDHPMPGLGYRTAGDTTDLTQVIVYNKGTVARNSINAVTLDVQNKKLDIGGGTTVTGLYKPIDGGGLGFSTSTPDEEQACIMPPRPEAYCLSSPSNAFEPVIFYVDNRAHSKPQADLKEYLGEQSTNLAVQSPLIHVQFISDVKEPYVRVAYTTDTASSTPKVRYVYYRVKDDTSSAIGRAIGSTFSSLIDLFRNILAGKREVTRYQVAVITGGSDSKPQLEYMHDFMIESNANGKTTIALLDDNLNPTKEMEVKESLSTDESGIKLGDLQAALGLI